MEPAPIACLKETTSARRSKLGLELECQAGANPYKAGLIGGNDAHVGV